MAYRPPRQRAEKPRSEEEEKKQARAARFQATPKSDFGLISRGEDDRLRKDANARTQYFDDVKKRCHGQCSDKALRALGIDIEMSGSSTSRAAVPSSEAQDAILMSLRKLREALLPLQSDPLHKAVFIFSVRLAVVFAKYQSLIPSLSHILDVIHVREPLEPAELTQMAAVYAYRTAHVTGDINLAYSILAKYAPECGSSWSLLRALTTHNYTAWTRCLEHEKDFIRHEVLRQVQHTNVSTATATLSKAYFTMSVSAVEKFVGVSWEKLEAHTWTRDGAIVTIRHRAKIR